MVELKEKKQSTVFWWLAWIVLTIVSFFVACYFWTWFIARYVGTMDKPGMPVLWVATVFGTWMVMLVPLIIVMYNKVDRAYEDTRMAREAKEMARTKDYFKVRCIQVPREERLLPKAISEKLKKMPQAIQKGHLMTVRTLDGRRVDYVFILNRSEVLGIYDAEGMPFHAEDVTDVVPADLDRLPPFESHRWLRLDGVGSGLGA